MLAARKGNHRRTKSTHPDELNKMMMSFKEQVVVVEEVNEEQKKETEGSKGSGATRIRGNQRSYAGGALAGFSGSFTEGFQPAPAGGFGAG